jgi:hypothetical protein
LQVVVVLLVAAPVAAGLAGLCAQAQGGGVAGVELESRAGLGVVDGAIFAAAREDEGFAAADGRVGGQGGGFEPGAVVGEFVAWVLYAMGQFCLCVIISTIRGISIAIGLSFSRDNNRRECISIWTYVIIPVNAGAVARFPTFGLEWLASHIGSGREGSGSRQGSSDEGVDE